MDTPLPPKRTNALRVMLGFVAPYRLPIVIALCALLFTSGITLFMGQGVRLLIDEGFATSSPELLRHYILIFFGLIGALALGTFMRFYWVTWLGERVVADIRRTVFSHIIDLHPEFFDSNRGLEIQSRLTADTTILQSVIGSSMSVALRNFIMMIGGVIWLFITNIKLTSIVVISLPLVVAPIVIFGRRVRGLSRQSQDRVADVGAYVGERLTQIKTVQAYNHQSIDKATFSAHVEEAFSIAKQRIVQRAMLITLVIVLVLGAIGMMLWAGGMDVINGNISGGELAAFVFYSIIVGSALGAISEVIGELQRAAGASERIVELLEAQNNITAPKEQQAFLPQRVSGRIQLDEVSFHYPSRPEYNAIDRLSLDIHPGETLAIVGPSGAGKSTLFDLLLRFTDSSSGRIYLEGEDIRQLDPKDLRKCFAFVSQHPALFFGSIKDNLAFGRPEATQEHIETAAIAANAHDFISQLPQGYDTDLGDSGLGLSGGQKQRLAIARALLVDAPILLLDEATSALDAHSEYLVQQALDHLMQGRTTLVVAHRLATVKNADRIAVMDKGKLLAVGTHHHLIKSNALYKRLADLQFQS
ncbi:ABC transporter transmembrane domain-containing protein [Agarilytica rhodophyticola]|uniref:ABC transporter transmembrane domain-containing protein n=1 Tax=Agarilytica rhodophyticola TaxID=1737490 RepID=UPI000B3488E8|nr:ABC transporter transmembrane domain-containing protein [Agarilytica rhodophyticola]